MMIGRSINDWVGQSDCPLIRCLGRVLMINGRLLVNLSNCVLMVPLLYYWLMVQLFDSLRMVQKFSCLRRVQLINWRWLVQLCVGLRKIYFCDRLDWFQLANGLRNVGLIERFTKVIIPVFRWVV